ncbi:hypothetical protein GH714_028694 [Hevea brasiliensis]|uniref:Uncharacterized protein n=1 Tax=Hevea brasiliensis TaxID=3981 RepID=A0A6A6K943_HEVBR|nr:hypothetical protein GH714_028694 [Hevea brasiliensis]
MSRLGSSRFARVEADRQESGLSAISGNGTRNRRHNVDETNKIPEESFKKAATKKMGKSLRAKIPYSLCSTFFSSSWRGELVIDSSKIALRYLRKGFWIDLITSLPVPQHQFLPRLYLILPLSSQLVEETGVVTKTALTAAVYNYLIFLLAANAFGACWYILSTERQEDCWHWVCNIEMQNCPNEFFDCRKAGDPARVDWFQSSNITYNCNPLKNLFPFGIMGWAVTNNVQGSSFLRNTLGQSFTTSTYVGENVFAVIITTTGLVFLALLIGNVQRYLQSTTKRLEVWKIQRSDTEQWMHHRHLPPGLRQSVRKYDQYKWLNAKGVDEEDLIKSLPVDLQKKVKRHLCFDLLRKVPLIDEMDENMLDAICIKLPLCSRTVKAINEVEAFTLRAEDLKFVASQFRKLHSKELRHKFRFYSHQWRIWAACTIQAAWSRHKTLKEMPNSSEPGMPRPGSFWSDYAESLVASTRWRNKYKQSETETDQVTVNSIEKPEEPDFSEEE